MIKTNYLTAVALGLLTALSGCQAEEEVPGKPQGTVPVGFSGDVPETRAAKEYDSAAELTDIGVFAYFTNGAFSESSSTPNFMYNQKVERQTDGSWTYSPQKFWPGNTTDKISFFAYAPYVDETASGGIKFKGKTEAGFPTLEYNVPRFPDAQVDLLAAVPLMNQGYTDDNGGTVKFQLKHVLTKVAVYVKSNDDVAGKEVTTFIFYSKSNGTLAYHAPVAGNADDTGTEWTYGTSQISFVGIDSPNKFAVPDTKAAEKKLLATFFLLPKGEGGKFNIRYTVPGQLSDGTTHTQSITLNNQPLPSLDTWKPGAFVSYTIGIEKRKITVTAATHPTWEDGGTGTVTGSFTITYAVSPTDPDWGNGGEGTVNGQPVVTHTQNGKNVEWTPGDSETLDGTEGP